MELKRRKSIKLEKSKINIANQFGMVHNWPGSIHKISKYYSENLSVQITYYNSPDIP